MFFMASSKSLKSATDNMLFFSVTLVALSFFALTNSLVFAKVASATLAKTS